MKFSKEYNIFILIIVFALLFIILYNIFFPIKEGYRRRRYSPKTTKTKVFPLETVSYEVTQTVPLPNIPALFPNYDDTYNIYTDTDITLNYMKNIKVRFYLSLYKYITLSSMYILTIDSFTQQDGFSLSVYPYGSDGKFITKTTTKIYVYYTTDKIKYYYLCSLPVKQPPVITTPPITIATTTPRPTASSAIRPTIKPTRSPTTPPEIGVVGATTGATTLTTAPFISNAAESINGYDASLFNIMTYLPLITDGSTGNVSEDIPEDIQEDNIEDAEDIEEADDIQIDSNVPNREETTGLDYDLTSELILPAEEDL
jgi:hypothetical protein